MIQLINQGIFTGNYNGNPNVETYTPEITTLLIEGIDATKNADRDVWINGPLTYTVTISNYSDNSYLSITFTDIIDPNLASLVENSVFVNDVSSLYEYNIETGLLSLHLESVDAGTETKIVYQVKRLY